MMPSGKVAIYIRVSTEEQVEGYSLEAQEKVLREEVKRQKKIVYKVYQDAGISGTKEDRNGLNQLIRDARKGCFEEVLVWKVSRISRKLIHLLKMIDELKRLGIAFRSLTECFDINTPIGQFSLEMMGAVAQMQRESWIESSKIAKEKRVKTGRWSGGTVLGYRSVPDETDLRGGKRLEIVPDEAETVQRIFAMYAGGYGYKAIVNRINEAGLLTQKQKPFSVISVKGVLENPVYIGKIRYRDQWWDGQHKPVISRELWETVRERQKQRNHSVTKRIERQYLLSGILRCPVCGSGMVPAHSQTRRKNGTFRINYYYICNTHLNKGKIICGANRVRADQIEQAVMQLLLKQLANPVLIRRVIDNIRQRYQGNVQEELESKQMVERMDQIVKQQRKLLFQYENDAIALEEFMVQNKVLREEKEELQNCLNHLDYEHQPAQPEVIWSERKIKNAFKQVLKNLAETPNDQKQKLIKNLVKEVILSPEREMDQVVLNLPFFKGAVSIRENELF